MFKDWFTAAVPGLSTAFGAVIEKAVGGDTAGAIKASKELQRTANALRQYLDAHAPAECYRNVQSGIRAALESFESVEPAAAAGKDFNAPMEDGYRKLRSARDELGAAEVACLGLPQTPAPTTDSAGTIIFATTPGHDLCSVGRPTQTVTTTDPIFFAAVLKHHLDGKQVISLRITKDDRPFVDYAEPANGTAFACNGNRDSLGPLVAGVYVFQVIHDGTVESTGILTVI